MTFDKIIYTDKLTEHRRNLHMIPELNRDLPKTKAYLLCPGTAGLYTYFRM